MEGKVLTNPLIFKKDLNLFQSFIENDIFYETKDFCS